MNPLDYAIVVGISRYPGLSVPPAEPADLQAPDTDVDAVCKWLTDTSGGGLPSENLKVIRSGDFPSGSDPEAAEPQAESIRKAFRWLQTLAEKNNEEREGLQVGRRLYIYMSGHGFSP